MEQEPFESTLPYPQLPPGVFPRACLRCQYPVGHLTECPSCHLPMPLPRGKVLSCPRCNGWAIGDPGTLLNVIISIMFFPIGLLIWLKKTVYNCLNCGHTFKS